MADESSAPVPLEERTVDFYGDQVLAVLVEKGGEQQVYVPLRPIAEYLGLDWSAQTRRIRRDRILLEALQGVAITATPSPSGRGGGPQQMLCLPLELLPGWLFGVDAGRVRPELQEKVDRYRRECFAVLWRAFQTETAPDSGSSLAVLRQVREMGRAIMQLADQQIAYQMHTNARLDRAAEVVKAMDQRLTTVERKLAAGPVTEEQAAEISGRVKALAEYLSTKEPGKVHYQAIFGELYRQFGVTSYKAIPPDRFDEVMRFLEDWRRAADERRNAPQSPTVLIRREENGAPGDEG